MTVYDERDAEETVDDGVVGSGSDIGSCGQGDETG